MDDPVEAVTKVGADGIDVVTNLVGLYALSEILQTIHHPSDVYHELVTHAPDARLSFLVAVLQGLGEGRYMAATRDIVPATYFAFMRGVASTGTMIGIWTWLAHYAHIKRRSNAEIHKHIAASALMGGTAAAGTVMLYKLSGSAP